MYAVTKDFMERMRADKRRVFAKVVIDYTDPTVSQENQVTATENANVSYPKQTADGITAPTHKWASLDGTWRLDGDYRLAPKQEDLYRYQFGWWSARASDADGLFYEPYPTLIVTHPPRPVYSLRVVGDSARGEWPVDFVIRLKGEDGTVLYTETVTGNTAVDWQKSLTSTIFGVARQELEIRRWSHPGRNAKILEFFTSIQETYYSDDIVEIKLLEEREASQGSMPVGNITANEIAIRLANEGGKFDVTNPNSPLAGLLKPNRRIRAWLGAVAENLASDKVPTFTRNSVAYKSDGAQVASGQLRFETVSGRKGVLVEEGTTNLITDSDTLASHSHGVSGDSSQITMYDASLVNGVYHIHFARTGSSGSDYRLRAAPSAGSYPITIDKTKDYVWSVDIKVVQGSPVEFWVMGPSVIDMSPQQKRIALIINKATAQADNGCTILSYAPIGDGFYRLVVRIPPSIWTGSGTTARVDVFTGWTIVGAYEYYYRRPQFERKQYATSWTVGTRAAETLTAPTVGVVSPSEGTVELWVYVNSLAKRQGSQNTIMFQIPQANLGNAGGIFVQHHASSPEWSLRTYNDAIQLTEANANDSYTPDGWHYFAVRWSTAEASLWIDGVKRATINSPNLPSAFAPRMYLGCRANNSDWLNTHFGPLRISSRARTDAEIAAVYAAGKLELDEDTTYLLTFNGSIYPVEQVCVPLGTYWSLDWDSPDDTLEATVTARDRLELLRKSTYQPGAVQQNVSLYALAEQVLIDAGLKAGEYWIDPALQQTVIPWAWLSPTSHRGALRIIAEAALAVVYADRDGVIRVESMGSVPDTSVLSITADDYFPPLSAPSRQDQVANEVVVTTQPLRPAATAQEVYRSTTPVSIPAGQTVTVTAFYTQHPVIEASASLDAPPAGVSITAATYYAWGAKVSIQNTGASQASVTLVVTGKPLSVQGGEQVIARDEQSIRENGVLRYEFPANPLVQTLAQAQAIASALLASAKDPRRDIEVEWRGNPALELGDRVTVVGQDVHVIRQEITWAGALSARLTGRKVT